MKKGIYLLVGILLLSMGMFTSCDETTGSDPYANWEVRNERYLDSIADVAHVNSTGEWKIFRAYSQDYETGSGDLLPSQGETGDYIYVKVIQDATALAEAELGEGNAECRGALFTDSVYVHYEITTPSKFAVGGLINGFTTALLEMHEGDHRLADWLYKGDRWEIYIPYQLGYGTSDSDDIPAYSVLIFDVALCRVWAVGETGPVWN